MGFLMTHNCAKCDEPFETRGRKTVYCSDLCRFEANYKVSKNPDECWVWLGSVSHNGSGVFKLGTKMVKAHRHSYELTVGPIVPGGKIYHICPNKLCVNPRHLRCE